MGFCTARSAEGEWKDIYEDPVRPRRNGYEWPPDFLQVGAWLAIFTLAILHCMLQIPYMNGPLFIVVLTITSVLVGSVLVTKITLELYSQEDPEVFRTDVPRLDQEELTEEAAPPGTEPCVFCRRFVQAGCKHCSVCDKCVPGFDHHCRWLNSCVGVKNYLLFAAFMGFAWTGMVWIAAMSLYTIIQALRDIDKFKHKMQTQAYHSDPKVFPAIMVFNFLCLALAIAGACALGKLIVFHMYLKYTNQSTYDHIMKKRQRKKEKGEYQRTAAAGSGAEAPAAAGACACLDLKKRRNFKKHGSAKNNSNNVAIDATAAAAAGEGGENEAGSAEEGNRLDGGESHEPVLTQEEGTSGTSNSSRYNGGRRRESTAHGRSSRAPDEDEEEQEEEEAEVVSVDMEEHSGSDSVSASPFSGREPR